MKVNGALIRKMRNDLGLTQELFSEKLSLSQRQVSRIENGESELTIFQFIAIMDLLNLPTSDFWLLYLDTEEYGGYRLYKKVKKYFDEDRIEKSLVLLNELENNLISLNPHIAKSIKHMRIIANSIFVGKDDVSTSNNEILKELYELLDIPNFDNSKITEYRLNNTELKILSHIASRHFLMDEADTAIKILESLYHGINRFKLSEEDYARALPLILINLSNFSMVKADYKVALSYANDALTFCRESEEFWLLPNILLTIADCQKLMGEEANNYSSLLHEAYYCARAMGRYSLGAEIKNRLSPLEGAQ